MTLYVDKRANSLRSYNNYKHICTKQQKSKYIQQTLTELKEEIDILPQHFTFNNGRKTIQKINKELEDLSNTINQLDITEIYKMYMPTAGYTFLSSDMEYFPRQIVCQAPLESLPVLRTFPGLECQGPDGIQDPGHLRSKMTWRLLPGHALPSIPSFLSSPLWKQPMSSPEYSLVIHQSFYCNAFSAPRCPSAASPTFPLPRLGVWPPARTAEPENQTWLSNLGPDSISVTLHFFFIHSLFLLGLLALRRQCGQWLRVKVFLDLDVFF